MPFGVSVASWNRVAAGHGGSLTDATVVPLPECNHTGGQIVWAAALVVMLILVTFLIRGVIKRRLQWAIALSLLLHFLLCLSMTTVEFRGLQTRPAEAADSAEIPREEFTLPDYAGTDQPSVEKPWEQPAEIETPEQPVALERPEMQLAEVVKPASPDTLSDQQPETAKTPERQDRVEMSAEVASGLYRQAADLPQGAMTQVEVPNVSAARGRRGEARIEFAVAKARG